MCMEHPQNIHMIDILLQCYISGFYLYPSGLLHCYSGPSVSEATLKSMGIFVYKVNFWNDKFAHVAT